MAADDGSLDPDLLAGSAHPTPLTIAVLYNDTEALQRGDATDDLADTQLDGVEKALVALRSLGHAAFAQPVTYANLPVLDALEADFALNLCEGSGVDGHPGVEVVAALEARGLPYSGVSQWGYYLSSGKWRMKRALVAAGVPVPHGAVMPSPHVALPSTLTFPLFVKPRDAYGSLGIDDQSLVHTPAELVAQVARIVDSLGTHAIVEQYIAGREISVGLVGTLAAPQILPPLEILFGAAHRVPVRTFATKHEADSEHYHGFTVACPAPLSPELEARVRAVALRAYRAVGCDGYARVDIRLSDDGTPFVLEVNANCSLEVGPAEADCALLPLMARAAGWSYAELLQRLIGAGRRRVHRGRRAPLSVRWCEGALGAHALESHAEGARLLPLGPIYPVRGTVEAPGALTTHEGRAVFVEPQVSHIAHADDPNLELVLDGGSLWLACRRPVANGEELTLDRRVPLPVPAPLRRPRAVGLRTNHADRGVRHPRPSMPAEV